LVKDGTVRCIDGTEIALKADTVCVHGDNPTALELIRKIRQTLASSGVEVAPVREFL
jgi:UPF0271 protein